MDFHRVPSISTRFPSVSIGFHGFRQKILWISKDFHGIPLFSTGLHRFPLVSWISIEFHWFPLDYFNFHWIPLISIGFHSFPPDPKDFYRISMDFDSIKDFHLIFIGFPLDSKDFHRTPWISAGFMNFPWIPWISIRSHGFSPDFHGIPWKSLPS